MKVIREPCPSCRAAGKDTSGDNLAVYPDGHKHCFACGYREQNQKEENRMVKFPSKILDLEEGIPEKGISEFTTSAWGVVQEYRVKNGTEYVLPEVLFPYYNFDQKLVGVKYRNFERERKVKKKCVSMDGEVDLFGLHMVLPSHTEVCIWEGETDTLNAAQCDITRAHLGVPGTGTTEQVIRKNAMFLRRFQRIYICFDNDETGHDAREIACSLLPTYLTYNLEVPKKYNDLTEAFTRTGNPAKVFALMMRNAVPVTSDALLTGDALEDSFHKYLEDVASFVGMSTSISGLDEMLGGGLMPGEVLAVVGHTGRGKSTFCAEVAYNIAQTENVVWIGSEMLPQQMLRKFIERDQQKRFIYREGRCSLKKSEINESIKFLKSRIVFYNTLINNFESVEEGIIASIHQYNCRAVFVDVLQDIDTSFSDWKRATEILQRIVALAQGNPEDRRPPVAVVLVCHTNGDGDDEISLSEIRGGGAVRQKSTCIVSIEGAVDSEYRRLRLLKKSRMNDADAKECIVQFDRNLRTYFEVEVIEEEEEEEEEPTIQKKKKMKTIDVEVINEGKTTEKRSGRNGSKNSREGVGLRTRKDAVRGQLPTRLLQSRKENNSRDERESSVGRPEQTDNVSTFGGSKQNNSTG